MLVAQFGDRNRLLARQAVAGAHGHDKDIARQCLANDIGAVGKQPCRIHHEIDLAAAQAGKQFIVGALVDRNDDVGRFALEASDRGRNDIDAGDRRDADDERPFEATLLGFELVDRSRQHRVDGGRMAREQPAEFGQRRAVARAIEHPHAEHLFQNGDAVGKRRLRYAQCGRGARERAAIGNAQQLDQPLGIDVEGHNRELMSNGDILIGHYGSRPVNSRNNKPARR